MKILGLIGFMAISVAGTLPYHDRISSNQTPDISGFMPGGTLLAAQEDSESCE